MNNVFSIESKAVRFMRDRNPSAPKSLEAEVADLRRLVAQLVNNQRGLLQAVYYITNPIKHDADRDNSLKLLRSLLADYEKREFPKPKSDDINYVIEEWKRVAGENRWVRALRLFASVGGNIKWYGGYPVSATSDVDGGGILNFELYDQNWESMGIMSRLKDIHACYNRLRGVRLVEVNY
jgi:hypothetical protein